MNPNYDFFEKFGRVAYLLPDGGLHFENADGDLFYLPDNFSDSEIESLMQKSLDDNYNYIFDLCKDNKFTYKTGCLY